MMQEENIDVDGENLLYSLSNNLDDIEIAIFDRTGHNIDLKSTSWDMNTKLCNGVKHMMNRNQVRYSMTISEQSNKKNLVVNMRIDDGWLITGFTEIEGSFESWEYFRRIKAFKKLLKEYSDIDSKKSKNLTIEEFFSTLELMFEKRRKNELSLKTLSNNLLELIEQCTHIDFCKKVKSYNLDESELLLFLCFCHLFISKNDNNIGFNDLKIFYEDRITVHTIKRSLSEGDHILVKNNYIESNSFKDGYNSETWRLSDKIKKELFSENGHSYIKQKSLILFESINERKMTYNAREKEAIQVLITLLQPENYRKIQTRLDAKGMRKGFTCLFSGLPGTGKTETAYQIARITGRNLMKVDISETKSMWLGESEKNIKAIFDNYRAAVKDSETAPILLLNEADAVIGKRIEFNAGNRAIDNTENRIQSIILEEMENFSGILIATSNLVQNMDTALERRFLYKITFDKPNPESRKGIWNTLFPDLPEDMASELSKSFEFSGGQIENIARKIEVDWIINGGGPSMDTLLQYCKEESLNSFNISKRIGFEKIN